MGAFREVSLKEARIKADAMRQRSGTGASIETRLSLNPTQQQSARLQLLAEPERVTVEMAFQQFWATKKQQLSNGKHAAQWKSTLGKHTGNLRLPADRQASGCRRDDPRDRRCPPADLASKARNGVARPAAPQDDF